jgi:spermidine synthase
VREALNGMQQARRDRDSGIATRYYNADIHLGAFALPQYVLQAIGKQDND